MDAKAVRSGLAVLLLLLATGCASKAVVLAPGPVAMPEGARQADAAAWSVWVSQARDVRPDAEMGRQQVGTLYTRFQKNPQVAYLEPAPAEYVRSELSRYLLHKGLEASGAQSARLLLSIELEECSVTENPGSVWDEVTVRVGYSVRLADAAGRELGRVRLKGEAQRKSPGETKRQAEAALRDALADTFQALARADVFQRAVQGQL